MNKLLAKAAAAAVENNTWKKFTNPTVARNKTAFPRYGPVQLQLGVRWDYDGEITVNDTLCHKFKLQPNAGQIPSTIKEWRDADKKGTHAVMADVFVKKDGTREDVIKGLCEGNAKVPSRSREEKKEKV